MAEHCTISLDIFLLCHTALMLFRHKCTCDIQQTFPQYFVLGVNSTYDKLLMFLICNSI